jgi:hypothetical protein
MRAMAVTRLMWAVAVVVGAGFMMPAMPLLESRLQPASAAENRLKTGLQRTPSSRGRGRLVTVASHRQADDKNEDDTAKQKSPTEKSRSDALAAERFELIQRHVAAAEIRSDEAGFPTRFAAKSIFKYSDPARGHVAAAVWKLGDEGRPKAILTSELDRFSNGRPCISHEYTSLTTTGFSIALDGMHWTPNGTLYQFKPLPEAPAPEKTPQRRLLQLRDLAKRFAGHEVVSSEKCELRLLPQPVDRYVPSKAERADGAIFFLTFGTNPEVMLLIESDGKQWSYAAGRMTGAQEVVVTLDQAIAWEGAPLQKGNNSPFTGSIAPVHIPGISADGREIDE